MSNENEKREIVKWITVHGSHVPIFKGENVAKKFSEYYRQRYINNWKKQEVDNTLDYYEKLNDQYNELIEEWDTLPSELRTHYRFYEKLERFNASEDEKQKYKDIYTHRNEFMEGKKGAIEFLRKYREKPYGSDEPFKFNKEKAKPEIQKAVDRHFNELQSKVEKKIGKITNIYHAGGNDYQFKGTDGSCAVEVIQAGGYNIQRLHTRWIVRNSLDH